MIKRGVLSGHKEAGRKLYYIFLGEETAGEGRVLWFQCSSPLEKQNCGGMKRPMAAGVGWTRGFQGSGATRVDTLTVRLPKPTECTPAVGALTWTVDSG